MINQEIERKFLVNKLPEGLGQYPHKDIIQGYLAITDDGTEVRLCQKGEKYFETVKVGSGETGFKAEVEITKDQFDSLWKATEGKRIEKTRYEIAYANRIIKLDVCRVALDGLLSAEIEFSGEEQSNNFVPPVWLGEEITDDKRYKNRNLALYGLPENRK